MGAELGHSREGQNVSHCLPHPQSSWQEHLQCAVQSQERLQGAVGVAGVIRSGTVQGGLRYRE